MGIEGGETPTIFHPKGCYPGMDAGFLDPQWPVFHSGLLLLEVSGLWSFEAGQLCPDLISYLNSWVASVCLICGIGWLDSQKLSKPKQPPTKKSPVDPVTMAISKNYLFYV